MAHEFVYTMQDLRKVIGDRVILDGITLSFLPGAKIGVLGANGAGKSTLLRIMAGVDTDILGEARARQGTARRLPAPGAEARSEEGRDRQRRGGRRRNPSAARRVQRALRPIRRADGGRRDERPAREAGQAPGPDRRGRRLGDRAHDRRRDGGAALPAWRRQGRHALGRREAPGRPLPAAALEARHAPARRADQSSRRRERRLARALPAGVSGDGRGDHPRPLFPRQRGGLDPRARPRPRDPVAGQLLLLARAEDQAPRGRGEASRRPRPDAGSRARVDQALAPRAPGQGQGPHQRLRRAREAGRRARAGEGRDLDSGSAAARQCGRGGREAPQGLRRQAALR